mgnify:CR=1 FL=1
MSKEMTLIQHLLELRSRLLICIITILVMSAIAFTFYTEISQVFLHPFAAVLTNGASINVNTIYEGFFVKLKLAVLGGICLSLPMILFQICRFILPGLKRKEKKWLFIIILISSLLSILSTFLGYVIVLPHVISFLLTNQFIPSEINILLNYQQNLSYITSFLIGGIIIFQTPIILAVCLAKNIVTRRFLLQNSRFFILGIIITSAIFTPPDIFSQLSLSLPLILCYFFCILLAKLMNWGHD